MEYKDIRGKDIKIGDKLLRKRVVKIDGVPTTLVSECFLKDIQYDGEYFYIGHTPEQNKNNSKSDHFDSTSGCVYYKSEVWEIIND